MESSGQEKQTVRVTILSRPYMLRTAGDPAEVEQVAESVDALMLAIASKAPNADSTHIAVLAAMHLADKVRMLEGELANFKDRVERKSEEYAGLLEQLMTEAEDR